jgi:isopentenyl phosphate kinase
LIPLVQGDVIFDTKIGGTIFSTEKCFEYLAKTLSPRRILLAGLDKGVYKDISNQNEIYKQITPENFEDIHSSLFGSNAVDVTGGMIAKVKLMLALVQDHPSMKVQIFSGSEPGNIKKALKGEVLGTLIRV